MYLGVWTIPETFPAALNHANFLMEESIIGFGIFG
jgi:hypothetical protein